MKRIILFVTEQELTKLKKMAESTGLAQSEIVRRALDEYFLREERRNRQNKAESEETENDE